jgi:hypothetical protein
MTTVRDVQYSAPQPETLRHAEEMCVCVCVCVCVRMAIL